MDYGVELSWHPSIVARLRSASGWWRGLWQRRHPHPDGINGEQFGGVPHIGKELGAAQCRPRCACPYGETLWPHRCGQGGVPVQAADGDSTVADVVYVDRASGRRVILEISVVTVGSDAALGSSSRTGFEGTTALLRAHEESNAVTASSGICLAMPKIILFSPQSACQLLKLWGLP